MDSLKAELRSEVDDARLEAALELIDSLPWEPRPGGEDYRMHLLRVARRVRCEFGLEDPDLTLAALLHDVLEDQDVGAEALREQFGERVTSLVQALTNEGDYTTHVLKTIHGPAGPVKLADFLDNALQLHELEAARRERLHRKYSPVAAGILAWLRDLPASHPLAGSANEVMARISARYP